MSKIEINKEACKSCRYCLKVCNKNVLVIGEKVNKTGYRYVVAEKESECISCLLCAVMCPECAIEFI